MKTTETRRSFFHKIGIVAASMSILPFLPKVAKPLMVVGHESYIPELWAKEYFKILQGNMVSGNLVMRDFESELSDQKDWACVNTERASKSLTFSIKTR